MKPFIIGSFVCLTIFLLTSCNQNTSSPPQNTTAPIITLSPTNSPTVQKTALVTVGPLINKASWTNLYITELNKHIGSYSSKFNIYDLDGNGIPELLISDGDIHAASANVYTVIEGKMVDLGSYGSWGDFQYDPINKYIGSGFMGQGILVVNYYKFINNKIEKMVSFFTNGGAVLSGSEVQYKVDDKSVSKEVYEAEYAKYNKNNYSTIARKYDITADIISQVISAYSD